MLNVQQIFSWKLTIHSYCPHTHRSAYNNNSRLLCLLTWKSRYPCLANMLLKTKEKQAAENSSAWWWQCVRSLVVLLRPRPFSPGVFLSLSARTTWAAIKRLTNACGYLVSLSFPLSYSLLAHHSHSSPAILFFFAGFHCAQVATPQRPSSPTRVAAQGAGRHAEKRQREWGEVGRAAGESLHL